MDAGTGTMDLAKCQQFHSITRLLLSRLLVFSSVLVRGVHWYTGSACAGDQYPSFQYERTDDCSNSQSLSLANNSGFLINMPLQLRQHYVG